MDFHIYRERDGAYLLLDPDITDHRGYYTAIANVFEGSNPSLGTCGVSRDYIEKGGLKRVQWSDLPEEWQAAFLPWMDEG